MKHISKLTIVTILFSLLLTGCTEKAADPTNTTDAPTAMDDTAALNSLFESMQSDMDSILLFPPEERSVSVYADTIMTRLLISFETDEARKKEREQGFTGLLEAHKMTDTLEYSDDEEKWKENADLAFSNVDLPKFVADLEAYNAKHSGSSSDTDEDEAAPVSMQDLTIEGEEAKAVLAFPDGIEFPVVFVKSSGQWFVSWDRTYNKPEGDSDFAAPPPPNTSNCENNLKQVGLAFRIWANDNEDQYPFNVPVEWGGTQELCQRTPDGFDANAFKHFLVMSNELAVPKLLICPADESTTPAADWAGLGSSHVTYLLRSGPQISGETPDEVLAKCPIHNHTLLCDGVVVQGKQ